MPLEFYFKPHESEGVLAFQPLLSGEKRAISGFIGYIPLAHCMEDDTGGSICFVEEGYMQNDSQGNVILPDDWRTEENNYHEISEGGHHMEDLVHQEWEEGEFLTLHRPAP